MPGTARTHFDEDYSRAQSLFGQGKVLRVSNQGIGATASSKVLEVDLYRVAVAFAVGAMDAYLCDLYVDCLTKALQKAGKKELKLPSPYKKVFLPIGPLVDGKYTSRHNWAIRMAVREKMERENLLRVGLLKDMINPVLPSGRKLWMDLTRPFLALNRVRFTGINCQNFKLLSPDQKAKKKKSIATAILRRIGIIVQRRHDIVHNCDRPKESRQTLSSGQADSMLKDLKSFVTILDDHVRLYSIAHN